MKNNIEKYQLLLKVFFVGMFGSISTRPLFFKKREPEFVECTLCFQRIKFSMNAMSIS